MAFRRSITSRAKLLLFHQQQRVALPFSRDDNDHEILPRSRNPDCFQRRQFGTGNHLGNFYRSTNLFQDLRFGVPAPVFVRNMSSHPADKMEITFDDITDVLGDKAVEVASQAAPVVNEVAIAAADSFFPVAALQHLIGYVHTFTGLNWWASIVLTTVLIRTLLLPLMIHRIKSYAIVDPLNPRMLKIKEEMESRSISADEGSERANELLKGYRRSRYQRLLVAVPVFLCFLLAINNMAGKVQSFKEGGALWFTDLATPDPLYILPVLTAMTAWIIVKKRNHLLGRLEGNPSARRSSWAVAALVIPVTATLPKAIFCYLITSLLYTLACSLALQNPEIKKMLGLPIKSLERQVKGMKEVKKK